MKRQSLTTALVLALAIAGPASAQNAGQIARARAGASCPGCNLFQADFANVTLKGKNYRGSRLRQADMSTAIMNRSNFAHTDMRDVNAYGALFSGADFSGANLTHATFVGAYLQGANFAGANLTGTNFSGAEMDRARGLTQRQLDEACGDEMTRLPARLHLRACN